MKREIGPFPLTIQKIKRISLNYKVKNEAKNQSLSNPTRRVGLGLFSFFRTRRPSSTSFTSYVLQFTIMPFNFKVKSKFLFFKN